MIEIGNNHKPLISIATPCWNSAKTIERTINSVLSQEFKDYEYIIVDGGSTDGTIEIIKKYEPLFEGRMKWKSEPDKGLYDAFNKGIERSSGKYCWNVNSDDYIERDALNNIKELLEPVNEDVVLIGAQNFVNSDGKVLKVVYNDSEKVEKIFRNDWMINHAATIVSKDIYTRYGYYDTRFKICADMDWFHHCYSCGVKFMCTNRVLTNFSIGGISTSFKYKREAKDRWLYFSKNYQNMTALMKFIIWHKMFLSEYLRMKLNKNA